MVKQKYMQIDVITAFPRLFNDVFSISILNRAISKKIIKLNIHNLREYGIGNNKKIDDYPYGGLAGMVLMCEPLDKLIIKLKSKVKYDDVIYLTPDGDILNQRICNEFSLKENIILICGHYKGIDHRIRDIHVTKEISIGNYVLTGGEIACMVFIDSIVRLIPGVLGDEQSALTDSHQDGLLAPPIYTRPYNYKGYKVPNILLSGDSKKINYWLDSESIKRTNKYKSDIL